MLFVTRELQIKTIRYHYTLAGIVKNPEIALQDAEQQEMLFLALEKCRMVQVFWKTIWDFLTKLNIALLYDMIIIFLFISPTDLKMYVHMKYCT